MHRQCACSLTSRARFVLWKAHVNVTEAFLVIVCEYDCFPLLPSQDSTTVVLLLFTSCRGHHSAAVRWENICWITEQQQVGYSSKLHSSWGQHDYSCVMVKLVSKLQKMISQLSTNHHEVELTVGRADGLKHKGYPAKLAAGHS